MKFVKLALIGLLTSNAFSAKAEVLPFTEDNWAYLLSAKTEEHNGQNAIRLGTAADGKFFGIGVAVAKVAPFTNGIVEYDVEFAKGRIFGGARFRVQGQGDFEDFYMRGHHSGNPDANQYMAQYNGIPAWELYYGPQYSAPTTYKDGWNHVKLAISGDLMDVYINDMDTPAFTSTLKRDVTAGGFALWGLTVGGGAVWFANADITALDSVEIKGTPAPAPEATAGTVLHWNVSNTFDSTTMNGDAGGLEFTPMETESAGLLNLAKLQGVSQGNDTAYARLTITAESATSKAFEFGFSDRAKVYLNGKALFSGNDSAFSRDYRFLGTVGFWDTVYLDLKPGENELLIGISESIEDRTGWAIQGRFVDPSGISFK